MEKLFFLLPRQIGKTTKAIYEYSKNPETSVIICHDKSVKHIQKQLNYTKNIISVNDVNKYTVKKSITTIIIDEHLFFSFKSLKNLHKFIENRRTDKLILFSTPNRTYNQFVIDIVKRLKTEFIPLSNMSTILEPEQYTTFKNDIIELYYSFMFDNNMKLITNYNIYDTTYQDRNSYLRNILSDDEFSLMIENKFIEVD